MVWHGSNTNGQRAMDTYCDAWHSAATDKVGLASSLLGNKLLEQERYSCDSRLIVLCIESMSASNQDQRKRRRKRNDLERYVWSHIVGGTPTVWEIVSHGGNINAPPKGWNCMEWQRVDAISIINDIDIMIGTCFIRSSPMRCDISLLRLVCIAIRIFIFLFIFFSLLFRFFVRCCCCCFHHWTLRHNAAVYHWIVSISCFFHHIYSFFSILSFSHFLTLHPFYFVSDLWI